MCSDPRVKVNIVVKADGELGRILRRETASQDIGAYVRDSRNHEAVMAVIRREARIDPRWWTALLRKQARIEGGVQRMLGRAREEQRGAMTLRACLSCGDLHNTRGPRCRACTSQRTRQRDTARGNRHERGLGSDHDRIRALILQGDPLCHWCAKEGKTVPATTADHVTARVDGGRNTLDNYVPACAPCNYRRGAETARARKQ